MDECSSQGADTGRLSVVRGGLVLPGSCGSRQLLALWFPGLQIDSSWVMALLHVLATAGNGDLAFSSLLISGWVRAGNQLAVVTLQKKGGRKPQWGGGCCPEQELAKR